LLAPHTLPALGSAIQSVFGSKAEFLIADWPWAIEMYNKLGGSFLNYGTEKDEKLPKMKLPFIQDRGYILFWTVNQKFTEAIEFLLRQGYR
jgi:hypothetical protein